MPIHTEPARDLPVVETAEVVVCGGGPAGVAAAVAAGRAGASVRLLEVHGCLGGVWTAGQLSWILDHANKTGIMTEILADLEARGARRMNAYDIEQMKLLLEQKCLEAGVKVRLHTRVAAAGRDSENRLAVAITESKSGREAWAGKVFVDATGDGDLAASAGCGFDLGRPENGECQPMSLMCLLTGVQWRDLVEAGFCRAPDVPRGDMKINLLNEMRRAGVEPSYAGPTLFSIKDDLIAMMANHEYGVRATNADEITAATLRARAEVHQLVDALRSLGGIWQNVRIVGTGEQIGVREGRRIHGRYTITVDDVTAGARFDDAVCRCSFAIDVHSTNPSRDGKYLGNDGNRAKPYDIPLRSLIAKDVDGLLLAGRCISGDFLAHSSYRVTGNAVAMGEAAGICAALAAKAGCRPHEVPFEQVQERLSGVGVSLPAD